MQEMSRKGPLIVEREEDGEETWSVCPTPGMCIKFRDAVMPSSSLSPKVSKFFVNLVHCIELPPPQRLNEDEVAKLLDQYPDGFRIPMCVGELDSAEDHNGEVVPKVDVVVNSDFFHQRISESEFFCQFTLRIICDAIKVKYDIQLDPKKQVILRNKKCQGELRVQRIRKRPARSLTPSTSESSSKVLVQTDKNENNSEGRTMDIDDIEEANQPRRPRNFKVQIVEGKWMDIRVRVRDQQGQMVRELDRITLKTNEDRVVVLLDGTVACADFFLPFRIQDHAAEPTFDPSQSTLCLKCSIKWN